MNRDHGEGTTLKKNSALFRDPPLLYRKRALEVWNTRRLGIRRAIIIVAPCIYMPIPFVRFAKFSINTYPLFPTLLHMYKSYLAI